MQILHILGTQPDETVASLKKFISDQNGKTFALYENEIDWEAMVEAIFGTEKVNSWR